MHYDLFCRRVHKLTCASVWHGDFEVRERWEKGESAEAVAQFLTNRLTEAQAGITADRPDYLT